MKALDKFRLSFVTMFLTLSCSHINAQQAVVLPEQYATITLQSYPEDAKVYYNGKLICGSTPATVQIPYNGMIMPGKKKTVNERMQRSAISSSLHLKFVKNGYVSGEEVITPTITEQKKSYTFSWPQSVIHEFAKKKTDPAYENDPTIPKESAKERVSRDNAGGTSLERTIIRWYFDSAPQGARIFWRVISSVPSEVKNTNELWLGSTPFEETRSFNIQGLTYANSRDVQIEIKVKRKGYVDQVKRFNVRQAIDQQEISSFFDLVEE